MKNQASRKEKRFLNAMEIIFNRDYPARMPGKSLVIALLIVPTALLGRTVHYDPAVVECRGKLRLVYFPGPPNYESFKDGDKREGVYILELEESFDIAATNDPKKPLNDSEGWGRNVKRIQLTSDGTLGRNVGKKVTVRGKLFEAIFAHHHTSVVMEVLKVSGE